MVPATISNQITADNANEIKAKVVVEAANGYMVGVRKMAEASRFRGWV